MVVDEVGCVEPGAAAGSAAPAPRAGAAPLVPEPDAGRSPGSVRRRGRPGVQSPREDRYQLSEGSRGKGRCFAAPGGARRPFSAPSRKRSCQSSVSATVIPCFRAAYWTEVSPFRTSSGGSFAIAVHLLL